MVMYACQLEMVGTSLTPPHIEFEIHLMQPHPYVYARQAASIRQASTRFREEIHIRLKSDFHNSRAANSQPPLQITYKIKNCEGDNAPTVNAR